MPYLIKKRVQITDDRRQKTKSIDVFLSFCVKRGVQFAQW